MTTPMKKREKKSAYSVCMIWWCACFSTVVEERKKKIVSVIPVVWMIDFCMEKVSLQVMLLCCVFATCQHRRWLFNIGSQLDSDLPTSAPIKFQKIPTGFRRRRWLFNVGSQLASDVGANQISTKKWKWTLVIDTNNNLESFYMIHVLSHYTKRNLDTSFLAVTQLNTRPHPNPCF
jgi:hypothetical protein